MSGPLVLSLFPGIGLLDLAFEEEGFVVVRGPDLLWGGDIRRFHPPAGRFEGVIGGPPCQVFSPLRLFVQHNGHAVAENLIPEFERVVAEASPAWFLMENVPAAPEPVVTGYEVQTTTIVDAWVGGETRRRRTFAFGSGRPMIFWVETLALHRVDPEPPVIASGGSPDGVKRTRRAIETRKGKAAMGYKTEAYLRKAKAGQGLPPDFLDKAPFTVAGKIHAIGNGVPLAMGRAVARAVKAATRG